MMKIIISKNNQQFGPYDEIRVREMLVQGHLSPQDWAIRKGDTEWRPVGTLVGTSAQASPAEWAERTLLTPVSIENKSILATLLTFLITLMLIGVLPALTGVILKYFTHNEAAGQILMIVGGILFVTLGFLFGLIFVVQMFQRRKFAAGFDKTGVTLVNGKRLEWSDLKHINFVEFRNTGVSGQGLIVWAVSKLLVAIVRRASERDDRARTLEKLELVFNTGKALVMVNVRNISELFDLIEQIPTQWCVTDAPSEEKIKALGFNRRTVNSVTKADDGATENVPRKSYGSYVAVAALAAIFLFIVGIGGVVAFLLLRSGGTPSATSASNSNAAVNVPSTNGLDKPIVYPDPQPESKPDFKLSASEFEQETEGLSIDRRKSVYAGKMIEITGRIYIFETVDQPDRVFLRAPVTYVAATLAESEISKLSNPREDEFLRLKCRLVVDFKLDLVDCAVLERKPPIVLSDPPDIVISAEKLWEETEKQSLSYDARKRNRLKYFGKVVEIEGEVFTIGSYGNYLKTGKDQWLTCTPDEKDKPRFKELKAGARATFRAIDNGISLNRCTVAK